MGVGGLREGLESPNSGNILIGWARLVWSTEAFHWIVEIAIAYILSCICCWAQCPAERSDGLLDCGHLPSRKVLNVPVV